VRRRKRRGKKKRKKGEEVLRSEKVHTEEKKLRWNKGEKCYEDRKKRGEGEK
jgi:hypothetical protein